MGDEIRREKRFSLAKQNGLLGKFKQAILKN